MNKNFEIGILEELPHSSKYPTIGNRVFDFLRQSIIQQKLEPGFSLSEAEVAKQLGVSRQPVREAFIKLAEAGLVEIRPQRGTFVTLISQTEVENARFIREVIEVALARRVAVVITDEDLADLQNLIEQLKVVNTAKDFSEFLALDQNFHVRISEIVDCQYAWKVLENLKSQIDRVRFLTLPNKPIADKVITQHQAIVDAFSTRSADLAEAAMQQHMRDIVDTLPSIVKANPKLFVQ